MRTSRAVAVSALLAVAAVNLLAACTPEDDNDVFETPGPPDPTPTPPDFHCQIVWTSQNVDTPSAVDVFVIDGAEGDWVGGDATFEDFAGFYQPGIDLAGFSVPMAVDDDGAVAATSGAFTIGLTVNGTADESDVTIANNGTSGLLVVGTDGLATTDSAGYADAYDFLGVWSSRDPESPAVDIGSGSADLVFVDGTNMTAVSIGDFGAYALCYDANAAAAFQKHPVAGLRRWHR